ncbi:hypothetical protein L3Y34_019896 [Caenorhabditis briggsae]|uniref:FTH domain-containing protein n=1 Tax=Caenorhabditis briggsae TaxID=6238 RepID=A0AAE9IWP7_CAEBR|nr:hypothetical protein L3Y34_019896 [Caenorhabditis briggsae]
MEPFDYIKCVLENLSLRKREQINYLIPNLRKSNSLIPFSFESVTIDNEFMRIDDREWNILNVYEQVEVENRGELSTDVVTIPNLSSIRFRAENYSFIQTVPENPPEVFKKLVDDYLRSGTRIRYLEIYSFPQCLENKDAETYKLYVDELQLERTDYDEFKKFLPIIGSQVRKVNVKYRESTKEILKEPLIINCLELSIKCAINHQENLEDLLLSLCNMKISIVSWNFDKANIKDLAAKWKDIQKPIGSIFTVTIKDYDYILDVFDVLKQDLEAVPSKVKSFGNTFFSNSITIPIEEKSEILVYGGPRTTEHSSLLWSLNMEVVPHGTIIYK